MASMESPFTQDALVAIFGLYNTYVWPLIPIFYLLDAASAALQFRPNRAAALFIALTLAAMWLMDGVGYHLTFLREINPGVSLHCAVLVLQAAPLIFQTLRNPDLRFTARRNARSIPPSRGARPDAS